MKIEELFLDMWQQFWLENIHYVLEVFVGFWMTTAGWIYFEGWFTGRDAKTLLRAIGFFVLALWSFLGAAPFGFFGTGKTLLEIIVDIAGLLGFGLVLASLIIDPVPVKPGEKPIRFLSNFWSRFLAIIPPGVFSLPRRIAASIVPAFAAIGIVLFEPKIWMLLMAALTTFLLWLHYSRGIQREWKFFYLGFLVISISLIFSLASILQDTSNVLLSRAVSPFQIAWVLEHIIKFAGASLLGIWAWGFIRFRIFPQIFSGVMAFSFVIFIGTAIIYTGFLLNRTQDSIIKSLETNVKTMNFAINKIKASAILAARIASANPQIKEAVHRDDKDALFSSLNTLMFESETDFMHVINGGGEIIMRAEDRERFGDSVSEDPIVWRAFDGKAAVTVDSQYSITIPTVSIRASSPIVDISPETGRLEIIGVVITGYLLDTAFVDGIKKTTGLDIGVFAGDTNVATTFINPETEERLIGVRETNKKILEDVIKKKGFYTGTAIILNQPFLASYVPIKDIEETAVGMFFTGISQFDILAAVTDTIQLTFSISLLLMIVSVIPIGLLAKFIAYHQKV